MKVRDISLEVMDISEEVMATRIYESTPMWLPSNSISSPLMLALLCLLLCAGHHFKQDVEDYIADDCNDGDRDISLKCWYALPLQRSDLVSKWLQT